MNLASARKAPSNAYPRVPGCRCIHFLALAVSKEINDVEILEVSAEVVSEIDAVGRVAACCSPVGGVTLQ